LINKRIKKGDFAKFHFFTFAKISENHMALQVGIVGLPNVGKSTVQRRRQAITASVPLNQM
jgi:ribosome biogenesis GTPase A